MAVGGEAQAQRQRLALSGGEVQRHVEAFADAGRREERVVEGLAHGLRQARQVAERAQRGARGGVGLVEIEVRLQRAQDGGPGRGFVGRGEFALVVAAVIAGEFDGVVVVGRGIEADGDAWV